MGEEKPSVTQRYRQAYEDAIAEGTRTYDERMKAEKEAKEVFDAAKAVSAASEEERKGRLSELYMHGFGMGGPITQDVIDVLVPTHTRTSCSDDELNNDDRCTRCFLMSALKSPESYLRDVALRVEVHRGGNR